jgi:hypothetical protein
MNTSGPSALSLRVTDQETARVVAIHRESGEIVGAGCLVDSHTILTCRHVVHAVVPPDKQNNPIAVSLTGVIGQPTVWANLDRIGGTGHENDIALLKISSGPPLNIPPAEFASPLRHYGKTYSVLGFPGGDPQGRNAAGRLHAADAKGLVQMDRGGALAVLGGFSGAPVWSSDLHAFVGIVVSELANDGVSWCIPSRRLCEFYPDLRVRFRIPRQDRPQVHDYWEDDPNVDLFGNIQIADNRKLLALITKDPQKKHYDVTLRMECAGPNIPKPRGHFATFITYPDFTQEREDAYELFAEFKPLPDGNGWYAEQKIHPTYFFTAAGICDGGDTALTIPLHDVWKAQQPKP